MKLTNVQQAYGERIALHIDSLEFKPGTIYAVIGSNGSGKTTLARIVSGTLKPTRGSRIPSPGERIGYMPQANYAFYGSVAKNIQLGLPRQISPSSTEGEQRIHLAMESLNLSHSANARAKKLSGGETARMALGRVLVGDYDLLVLDEPTAALDVNSTLTAENLIRLYRDQHGAAIMMITHSISQAQRLADQVLFMESGKIAEYGHPQSILQNPRTTELRQFIEVLGA